jgi:hypothetical protein
MISPRERWKPDWTGAETRKTGFQRGKLQRMPLLQAQSRRVAIIGLPHSTRTMDLDPSREGWPPPPYRLELSQIGRNEGVIDPISQPFSGARRLVILAG